MRGLACGGRPSCFVQHAGRLSSFSARSSPTQPAYLGRGGGRANVQSKGTFGASRHRRRPPRDYDHPPVPRRWRLAGSSFSLGPGQWNPHDVATFPSPSSCRRCGRRTDTLWGGRQAGVRSLTPPTRRGGPFGRPICRQSGLQTPGGMASGSALRPLRCLLVAFDPALTRFAKVAARSEGPQRTLGWWDGLLILPQAAHGSNGPPIPCTWQATWRHQLAAGGFA